MTRRTLLILAGLAAALALVLLVSRVDMDRGGDAGGLHAPGLAERIGDLYSLRVVQAGNEVVATVERGESGWAVAEKGGHRADFARFRGSLQALSQARRVEKKTALPEFHSRLGVEDPEAGDAGGYLLELDYGGRHPAEGYIVGNRAGAGMVYIRTAGEAQSWMVSADFDLSGVTRDWVDREVIDLASSEVRRVALDRGEGDVLEIARDERGDINFTPLDIPEGRELSYGSVANPIASALANVQANDVLPAADADGLPRAVLASYETFDGLAVRVDVREAAPETAEEGGGDGGGEDPRYWAMLSAAALEPAAGGESADGGEAEDGGDAADAVEAADGEEAAADGSGEAESGGEAADGEEAAGGGDSASEEPAPGPGERAAELNARLAGWAYELPAYKSDQWFKKMDDLLKDEEAP